MSEQDRKDVEPLAGSGELNPPQKTVPSVNTDTMREALEKFFIENDARKAVTHGRGGRFLIN